MPAASFTDVPPDVLDRVARARVARLATRQPDGRADLVPITFALVGAGAGTRLVTAVDHKPKTTRQLHRLDRIRRDPGVSVLVDHYDDGDWDQLWWVRATGRATIVEVASGAPAEASAMIDALVAKYPQYRDVRPEGPVIVVTPTAWQWWSATTPESSDDPDQRQEHP